MIAFCQRGWKLLQFGYWLYSVTLIWSLTIIGKFLVKPNHNSHCFACIECVMKEHVDN